MLEKFKSSYSRDKDDNTTGLVKSTVNHLERISRNVINNEMEDDKNNESHRRRCDHNENIYHSSKDIEKKYSTTKHDKEDIVSTYTNNNTDMWDNNTSNQSNNASDGNISIIEDNDKRDKEIATYGKIIDSNKNIQFYHKIGNNHHVIDCIRSDIKRNRKETIEKATMHNNNDDDNDSPKLTVRSASINHHTNQDCDSDNDFFSPRNHENSRCNDDNDNNKQNKEQSPELSIAHDYKKRELVDRPHQIIQISTTTTNSLRADRSICNENVRLHLQQHIKSNDGSSDNNVNNMSSSGSLTSLHSHKSTKSNNNNDDKSDNSVNEKLDH